MTTADLDLPGPGTRFYVNERLTKVNHELFRSAREAGSRQVDSLVCLIWRQPKLDSYNDIVVLNSEAVYFRSSIESQ